MVRKRWCSNEKCWDEKRWDEKWRNVTKGAWNERKNAEIRQNYYTDHNYLSLANGCELVPFYIVKYRKEFSFHLTATMQFQYIKSLSPLVTMLHKHVLFVALVPYNSPYQKNSHTNIYLKSSNFVNPRSRNICFCMLV